MSQIESIGRRLNAIQLMNGICGSTPVAAQSHTCRCIGGAHRQELFEGQGNLTLLFLADR